MKHMSLRNTSSAGLLLVGTILAAGAFAQAPQGRYGPGYGMGPGMMNGYGPEYGQGPGSGMLGGYGPPGYGQERGYGQDPGTMGGYGPRSGFNRTR
jgi:hypothetical protein